MRQHKPEFEEKVGRTDQGTIVRDISYECKVCGSGLIGTINLTVPGIDVEHARKTMRDRLQKDFPRKFVFDCEEAARLNVCRAVHDS